MEKNITVLDMQGNVCGATYPKRARGLVKKGRARFVDEKTICFACPPNQPEDTGMDQIQIDTITENETVENMDQSVQLDASYLIEKVDQIVNNTEYLTTALKQLEHIEGDAAIAAGKMIECRERTNQRMIEMLEKLMGKLTI